MRYLSAIVGITPCVVVHGRKDYPVRCRVAPQLVCHDATWLVLLSPQQLAKEPFGRAGIAMPLNEYVDYIPVLIDGPPEIVALTLDVHENFVQMPHVS
jgi:hypothetical protein